MAEKMSTSHTAATTPDSSAAAAGPQAPAPKVPIPSLEDAVYSLGSVTVDQTGSLSDYQAWYEDQKKKKEAAKPSAAKDTAAKDTATGAPPSAETSKK